MKVVKEMLVIRKNLRRGVYASKPQGEQVPVDDTKVLPAAA